MRGDGRSGRCAGALPLLIALLAACGSEPGATDPQGAASGAPLAGRDCIVIVLDALHAAHLGCYGGPADVSPNIDALAGRGTRFARAWSQASWTLPSTVSLFTGLYPETHGVAPAAGLEAGGAGHGAVRLADEATTLPELFAAAGYATHMYTQNPFASDAYGLAQGVGSYHEVRSDGTDLAARVVADLRGRDDRPLFAYLHFRRPHTPFDPAPEHAAELVPPGDPGPVDGSNESIEAFNMGRAIWSADDLARHQALYRANIRHVDAALGALFEALDPERTLVVLLSDHGEAVGQHGRLGHNWLSYEEYVHVPLILAGPGVPVGRAVDAPVMTVDVLPTLQEWFGLEAPLPPPQGRSLQATLDGPGAHGGDEGARPRLVFSGSRVDVRGERWLAVSDGRHKLLRRIPNGRLQLYDLAEDPGETRDLWRKEPDVVTRLARALDEWYGAQRPLLNRVGDELDAETLERLRALGYVLDGR